MTSSALYDDLTTCNIQGCTWEQVSGPSDPTVGHMPRHASVATSFRGLDGLPNEHACSPLWHSGRLLRRVEHLANYSSGGNNMGVAGRRICVECGSSKDLNLTVGSVGVE